MARVVLKIFMLLIVSLSVSARVLRIKGLPEDLRYPRHVHLSLGVSENEMIVTWTTFQPTNGSVQYGLDGSNQLITVPASNTTFVDGGSEKRKLYIFRGYMFNLKPNARYMYRVGADDGGWSALYFFKTHADDGSWSPVLAVYGDLGSVNGRSIGRLQTEAQFGTIDAVIHDGDFAYNMESDNGRVGDQFMDQIENIAAYVPYMTAVGNHEAAYNFSNYRNRFSMPGGDGEGLWYSFDYGPAHFIAISTEVYFYLSQGMELIHKQKEWLKNDLEKANKNRASRPWVILFGHRPMYCSNNDHDDCTYFESMIRYAFEDMLYNAGVDIFIWAHEHSYERAWPVYNRTICNGTEQAPYTNPRAPVHIVTGSAGMSTEHDPFEPDQPFWSAFRSLNYGYSRFHLKNSTHILIEQVDDESDGKVIDEIWVVKYKHGPGLYDCHLSKQPKY